MHLVVKFSNFLQASHFEMSIFEFYAKKREEKENQVAEFIEPRIEQITSFRTNLIDFFFVIIVDLTLFYVQIVIKLKSNFVNLNL